MATRVSFRQLTALALTAAALVGYEVLLTRLIAIHHWHHLTAVVIAVALLGGGCAGSLAAAFSSTANRLRHWMLPTAALTTAVSIPVSLKLAGQVPLNMLALPWYWQQQSAWLLLYALCFLIPFLSGALYITLVFMRWSLFIGRCYAADLGGSALGVALVLFWLDGTLPVRSSLESAFGVIACLPVLTFWLSQRLNPILGVLAGILSLIVIWWIFAAWVSIQPSAFKPLAVQLNERGAQVLNQKDTSQSRLTLIDSRGQHAAPGLSIKSDLEAPRQWQVYTDGGDAMPVLLDATHRRYRPLFGQVITSAAYRLLAEHPNVLVLPGNHSWNSWIARWHQSASVTLVEPDPGLARMLAGAGPSSKMFLPRDSHLQITQPRRFLQSTAKRFDLIIADMGSDPVGSAATRVQFSLTREALEVMYNRLSVAGILAVSGRTMPLPRDSLRLQRTLIGMLQEQDLDPTAHLVVIRDWQNILVMVSRAPFSRGKLERLSQWCRQWGFDRVAMPGLKAVEANRFHEKPDAIHFEATRQLLSGDAFRFAAAYPFDISITDDNRPFFYHFFRWGHWRQVQLKLGQGWLLYVGWGYLLNLVALIALALTALGLIFAPLAAPSLRRQLLRRRWAIASYFGALGLGFMLVEMALIQKAQLLLDAPTTAFAAVLVALLIGAGGGSLWSVGVDLKGRHMGFVLFSIACLSLLYIRLFDLFYVISLPWSESMRVLVLILLLVILAVPMGIMLPQGIVRIRQAGSGAVAWAWAINGFFSVLGALAAPLLSMEIGIRGVVACAVGFYLTASLSYRRLPIAGVPSDSDPLGAEPEVASGGCHPVHKG